jgi:hypothetical protein
VQVGGGGDGVVQAGGAGVQGPSMHSCMRCEVLTSAECWSGLVLVSASGRLWADYPHRRNKTPWRRRHLQRSQRCLLLIGKWHKLIYWRQPHGTRTLSIPSREQSVPRLAGCDAGRMGQCRGGGAREPGVPPPGHLGPQWRQRDCGPIGGGPATAYLSGAHQQGR